MVDNIVTLYLSCEVDSQVKMDSKLKQVYERKVEMDLLYLEKDYKDIIVKNQLNGKICEAK